MKFKNIVLLYNLQRKIVDPSSRDSLIEADYDSIETIDGIYTALCLISNRVKKIEGVSGSVEYFVKNKKNIDLVFNYSVGEKGINKYAHFPTVFEMLGIPYTGLNPLSQSLVSNKNIMKNILVANGINTPRFLVINKYDNPSSVRLKYPLIIKPIDSGSSAGMTQESIIRTPKVFTKKIKYFLNIFDRILVEEFLDGREISVSMVGNPPRIFPISELNHELLPDGYERFASFEVKNQTVSLPDNYFICPAKIAKRKLDLIKNMSLKIWKIFELRDWARIDMRFDGNEDPYVLDINSPASLEPPSHQKNYCSFTNSALTDGVEYNKLIKTIVESARNRNRPK